MGKPKQNGCVRTFYNKQYRLVSIMVDGVRRQRFEHRLIMEEILGRPLTPDEIVHHKDEDGLNNTPDNLELTNSHNHQHIHHMIGPHKWDLNIAIEMRENGSTFAEIGNLYGVSYTAIMAAFKRRGLPTKDHRWGKNKWDVAEAILMYSKGATLASIAKYFDIKPPSVRKAFINRKIKLR